MQHSFLKSVISQQLSLALQKSKIQLACMCTGFCVFYRNSCKAHKTQYLVFI